MKSSTKKVLGTVAGLTVVGGIIWLAVRKPKPPEGSLPVAEVELNIYETDTGRLVGGTSGISAIPARVEPNKSYTVEVTITNKSTWRGNFISYPFLVEFNAAMGSASLPQQAKNTALLEPNVPTITSFDFILTDSFLGGTVTFSAKVKTLAGVLVVTGTKTASCMYLVDFGMMTLTAKKRGTAILETWPVGQYLITAPDESYKISIPLTSNYSVSTVFTLDVAIRYYRPGPDPNNPILDSEVVFPPVSQALAPGVVTNVVANWPDIVVPLACSGGGADIYTYVSSGGIVVTSKLSRWNAESIIPGGTVILT